MKFALIGAAGYVAPKHMKAIRDVGGDLVAALDPHDSVGILDRYYPGCLYFREPERFDRWLSKNEVDYVSVCSPNYLHDAHCLMAMRNGADVICEKPLVLNERNLDNLNLWEEKTHKKVNVILQSRLHPNVEDACRMIDGNEVKFVDIQYITPRGEWYNRSWKGYISKSGGLTTNIGIHLFDLVGFLIGDKKVRLKLFNGAQRDEGFMSVGSTIVHWFLSTSALLKPKRVFKLDKYNIDLSNGFDHLHSKSYLEIVEGNGFGIEDIRFATRVVEGIRNAKNEC